MVILNNIFLKSKLLYELWSQYSTIFQDNIFLKIFSRITYVPNTGLNHIANSNLINIRNLLCEAHSNRHFADVISINSINILTDRYYQPHFQIRNLLQKDSGSCPHSKNLNSVLSLSIHSPIHYVRLGSLLAVPIINWQII